MRDWQVRFGGGHQQGYLPERPAGPRYALGVGPREASSRSGLCATTTLQSPARDALLRAPLLPEQRT